MVTCPSCAAVDRRGYCAPLRCYCAHADCHAAASYVPLLAPSVTPIRRKRQTASKQRGTSAWDERSGDGWIDKL